jgi:hypothetical protein
MLKKYFYLLILIAPFFSCKNDFNIAAPWKEIPIVYGLLDADSSIQYIRVERAFLDAKTSALKLAANPDSIYYTKENLIVELDGFDATQTQKQTIIFKLVDGDTMMVNGQYLSRPSGTFANQPNLLYVFRATSLQKIVSFYYYNLVIKKSDGTLLASSTTNVVGAPSISVQNPMAFVVKGLYNTKFPLSISAGDKTAYCDGSMRFRYKETNIKTSVVTNKYVDIPLFNSLAIDNITLQPISNQPTFDAQTFYEFLSTQLTADPNIIRDVIDFQFFVFGYNQALTNYVDVQIAQSGIVSGTAQTQYSNITNGLGIFASRTTKSFSNYQLDQTSLDTLKKGQYTYNLGFNH